MAADQPDGTAVRRERADLVALTTAGTGVERELFLYLAGYRTRERQNTSAAVYSLIKRAQAELTQSPHGHALAHATLLEALARFDDEHPIPAYTAEPASNPRFDCIQWQPSRALIGAISDVLLFLASEHGRTFGYAGGAGAAMDFGTEHGATISVLPWQWIARHHDGTITLHDSNPLSPNA